MAWSEESEFKAGGGTKSENTDQAVEFAKVQSRNSRRYNPSRPLFLPRMKAAFPAVFCACFNFLPQYQQSSTDYVQLSMATAVLSWPTQTLILFNLKNGTL